MPSSLHLFDPERHALAWPETFEALEALRQSLHARVDGKNLRFVEFALRFEDRFGAASTGRATPLQQANACRRAAWQFDLPAVDELPAYQAAVEIAGALGLVAYDAALGLGFLPDGRVVPAEFAPPPPTDAPATERPWGARPPDALRGESEVCEVLIPALSRAMAPAGFVLEAAASRKPDDPIVLSRRLGPVRQALIVKPMRYEQLILTLHVWHDACTAVLGQALGPEPHEDEAFKLDLKFFEPGPDSLHRWYLDRLAQLPAVLALVCGRVLPLAVLCCDLHGLDQVLNDTSAEAVRTPYRNAYPWMGRPAGSDGSRSLRDESRSNAQRLVVAHLNGNPAAADIASELEADWRNSSHRRAPKELEALAAVRAVLALTPALAGWPDVAAWRAALRPVPAALLTHAVDPRGRRCHCHEVTAALLQDMRQDPAAFWARFARPEGAAELARLWNEVAATLPAGARLAPDGLGCSLHRVPGKTGEGAIDVVCLRFPPITGLDEDRMLALAHRGDVWGKFRMGYAATLDDDGRMQLRVEYTVKNVTARDGLDAELGLEAFLQKVGERFE